MFLHKDTFTHQAMGRVPAWVCKSKKQAGCMWTDWDWEITDVVDVHVAAAPSKAEFGIARSLKTRRP